MPRYSCLLACMLLICSCWSNSASAQASSKAVSNNKVVLLMSEELDGKGNVIPLSPEVLELLRYLEQQSKLRFELRRYPWKRALENAANGEGLIFGISKTPERLRSFKFSLPIFTDQSLLVTLCSASFSFNSINDLKGKTIGRVRGTSHGEEFDRQSNVLFKVEDDTGNNSGRFRKLYMRRMDAFLMYSSVPNTGHLENYINQQYTGEFTGKQSGGKLFCILPKPVSAVDIHIAIKPEQNAGLIEKIDRAILHGRQNGDLARIYSPK